jgi:hypothetical protein
MLDNASAQQLSLTAALEKLLAVEVNATRARRSARVLALSLPPRTGNPGHRRRQCPVR